MNNSGLQVVPPAALEVASQQMEALKQILEQKTPSSEIRYRKGKGGKEQAFVDHAYVTRLLNQAFGHDWDFEADNEEVLYFNERPFETRVRGKLTVRMGGRTVVKMQFGSMPIEYRKDGNGNLIEPVTIGDTYKGAASDALKKCASLLGVALDLYDSDNEVHGKQAARTGNAQRPAAGPNKGQLIQQLKAAYLQTGGNEKDWPDYFKQKDINSLSAEDVQKLIQKMDVPQAA